MRRGAIAVIDALGFAGIWRGKTPEEEAAIFNRLVRVRSSVETFAEAYKQKLNLDPRSVLFRSFSDTVFLGVLEDPKVGMSGAALGCWCVLTLSSLVSVFVKLAALFDGPPLIYRGALAFGEYENHEDFWMGPAVDEAARAERLAEAAVVWLCPSALAETQIHTEGMSREETARDLQRRGEPLIRDYDVPLKGGRRFRTHVVNPFEYADDRDSLRDTVLRYFDLGAGLDVEIKRQNTSAFLSVAIAKPRRVEPVQ
ncbi:MAG: hypothetical protein ACRERC_20050 [Candidatus Binatia bacterium]